MTIKIFKLEKGNGTEIYKEDSFEFIRYEVDEDKTWAVDFSIEPYEMDVGTY